MVKEGYKFAAAPSVLGILMLAAGWYWAAGASVFIAGFVLYFFRDPERAAPVEPGVVVSPADGRVVEIVEEALDGRFGKRISIFLSLWNVHINRAPIAGRISRVDYRPGRFFVALRSRASAENEQNVIHLATERGVIMFKQIAGWIARRVLFWKSEGDVVAIGERVGMIRFGSRVDIWLPQEADITVRSGDNVEGGTSILARWS